MLHQYNLRTRADDLYGRSKKRRSKRSGSKKRRSSKKKRGSKRRSRK